MKVAYLINQYPAPSHGFIRREIAALRDSGVVVFVFSIRRFSGKLVSVADQEATKETTVILGNGWGKLFCRAVITILTHPLRSAAALSAAIRMAIHSDRGIARHFAYFVESCTLRHQLEACGAEHLHVHFGTNPAAVAMLCHLLGGPRWSFTAHGPEEFVRGDRIALAEKIKQASFVIGISEYAISELHKWCEAEQVGKLKLVRCGLDDELLHAPVTAVPNVNHLVCVGRLCEEKMQHVLIAAVGRLAAQKIDVTLTLVGDGPTRQQLETQLDELGLRQQIRFAGWCSDSQVRTEILAARVKILSSRAEGLPVAIMEAYALSRPVISTQIAAIPELIESGRSGWLVEPNDVDALANAIQTALTTPTSRLSEMACHGRERVLTLHDARKNASELRTMFISSARD